MWCISPGLGNAARNEFDYEPNSNRPHVVGDKRSDVLHTPCRSATDRPCPLGDRATWQETKLVGASLTHSLSHKSVCPLFL